ncbi:ribonuclease P protein component 4 [Methanothermobacter sp. CaT2]|uniref:ribonuclease P protein component 4 n=1 Tax=Methanothermobacter sp. CaT2 TaxID=866790 RepID=UPI00064FC2BF|nr:ribonuclease P protein component 4 [Methanothermobacter sp. CaT2]HIH70466.1 ribonuclease P [Methanothermobacter thermautotrophicus]HOQ18396.1 ribonuclease P protein component 4 [Methanothermobacter thermautotrophicus]
MRRGKRPRWMLKIAEERIDILFRMADREFSANPHRSHRYTELARNIAMKYRVRIPREWRRRFCRKCYSFLKPGANCTVRIADGKVNFRCHECGHIMRFPYIREKKDRRRNKIESHTTKEGTDEKVTVGAHNKCGESRSDR